MRKICVLLIVVLVLATPTLAQEGWVCPEGFEGQTLNVYNWTTYVAEDTVPNFEEACGVTVEYDVYESNEAMLARIRPGNPGYDIVVPSNATAGIMIREGLLLELNKDLIPNEANVIPNLLDPQFDPGNAYTLPYQWGTIGLGVNLEALGDYSITTWDDVWAYEGNVAWLEDLSIMIGLGLTELGYDPNSENLDEIAEARDFLIANGGNVVAIAGDDGQVMLERGDADVVIEYSGDIFQVMTECDCDTYAYIVPEDGSNVWTDNIAVPVGAPNPDLAMVFIDYILDAQVGADLSNYTGYGSPNQASFDAGLIDEAALNNPGIYPPAEVMQTLWYAVTLPPEVEQAFNDTWDEVKIFLGQ